MIILLSAVSHSVEISGVQRHALNLTEALLQQDSVTEVHLVVGSWQRAMQQEIRNAPSARLHLHVAGTSRGALRRNLWHYGTLPALAARLGADILHVTYPVPLDRSSIPCAIVATLHDLYPYQIPSNFGFPKYIANRFILRSCLQAVDAIACVSRSTQALLARYMPPAVASKGVFIPNSVTLCPIEEFLSIPEIGSDSHFLLCVAQHRRNKNIAFLLRVFHHLLGAGTVDRETQLAIVGITGPETPSIVRLIQQLRLQSNLVLLDGLSNAQLRWLYAHADAVLAPSQTEGFGFPLVEAMLAGCRVICSDIPAFRELASLDCRLVWLGGRSAEQDFSQAVQRSLQQPKPRAMAFPEFSSEAVGSRCLELYQQLLAERLASESATKVLHQRWTQAGRHL